LSFIIVLLCRKITYTQGVMENQTQGSTEVLSDILRSIFNWFSTNFTVLIYIVVVFFSATIVAKIISRAVSRLLSRTIREDMFPSKIDRNRRIKTLDNIAEAIISFVVWTTAIIMIMNLVGINTAPLLASAGILGVALGFGAQSLVKDFITGMFIIIENQYRVGDFVEIQNVKGTVKAVTMRTTIIQDSDGSIFHIPNGSIIVTGNHTMGNNKVSVEISASTETDMELLQKIINTTGLAQAKILENKDLIIEPMQFSRVKEIVGGVVKIRITGKVKSGMQNEIKSKFLTALQNDLVKNKIALK